MKKLVSFFFIFASLMGWASNSDKKNSYNGVYCSGKGDTDFLRLIDESFAFFHPNPVVPNLTMIYNPDWDTFTEGAGWGAWWIQNSYGFSYSATPFLEEPWFSTLQRSWDIFWGNQGDGKRKGAWGDGKPNKLSELVAPDGSLGDCAAPGKIVYKQGDGNVNQHDWFYEATAAGVVMQAEILLAQHDLEKANDYLPKMARACDCIERTRDPKNNLFLVGAACNLLAPSYGGVKLPDGTLGKAYLSGLSVTYLAAIDRMIELYKMTGDHDKLSEYLHRQKITRESLSQLLTPEGYFTKYIEPDGTKHGAVGQEKYGYLEGVVNADAVALRVADIKLATSIYNKIASLQEIRPFDFLLTNAPGLDDTYVNWGSATGPGIKGFWKFGDWVNGGAWGTVEGRAILMYYRLGKFEDVRRSAIRAMKWAKDFRMDEPWSQCGENTSNPWSDTGKFKENGVSVMVDNFAIPAATIRGLFDYEYQANQLILRPRVPQSISQYTQKQPIRFGTKKIYISCQNNGPKVQSVKVNGKTIKINTETEIGLNYNDLPEDAKIEIVTTGKWPEEPKTAEYPYLPALRSGEKMPEINASELPESLKKPFITLTAMLKEMDNVPAISKEKESIQAVLTSITSYKERPSVATGPGYYRAITPERKEGIQRFYEKTALTMYSGFEKRMAQYANSSEPARKKLADLFVDCQKKQN
jgi:hypothetical protein